MTQSRTLDERTLSSGLLRLARLYRRAVNRALAEHGLSDARALPILYIARSGGGMRQVMLAEEVGIEGPSLVRLLDQLCGASLVERRDDPTDRRAKTLHLTEQGRELAAVVEDTVQEVRAQLLAKVDDADLAAAVRVFSILEAALEEADGAGRRPGA